MKLVKYKTWNWLIQNMKLVNTKREISWIQNMKLVNTKYKVGYILRRMIQQCSNESTINIHGYYKRNRHSQHYVVSKPLA